MRAEDKMRVRSVMATDAEFLLHLRTLLAEEIERVGREQAICNMIASVTEFPAIGRYGMVGLLVCALTEQLDASTPRDK